MAGGVFFFFFLILTVIFPFSLAGSDNPHPQELKSFKIREAIAQDDNNNNKNNGGGGGGGRGCSYTVKIKTSCSSPKYTRDAISLAFGDAYGNQVYAPRLDDPSSGTFERCSTDTFKIQGPCGSGTCYLYLRRNGRDGWIPDSVNVYEVNYNRAVTFYYGSSLPNGIWYGFNQCSKFYSSFNATELASNYGSGVVNWNTDEPCQAHGLYCCA